MTERLSTLLRGEADALAIPPAPADGVIAAGRRQRARRQAAVSAGSAALALVAVAAAVWLRPADDSAPQPAPAPPPPSYVAFGVGSTVHLDDAQATVPDTVHSLHYTSVGVLVRSNPNDGASDGSGPETLTLVREDGSTVDLGTIPEGVGPATDPAEPYYVLAEAAAGDGFEAVVREAEDGSEVARVALPDRAPSYWAVPPLSLSGDLLYVGYRASTMAVDWRTGAVQEARGLAGGLPEVHGGLVEATQPDELALVDAVTGESVLTVPMTTPGATISLSPSGRYALVADHSGTGRKAATVLTLFDTSEGGQVVLDSQTEEWGWSSDDRPFLIEDRLLVTCDPTSGDCTSSTSPLPSPASGDIRLGGRVYES